ncbi:hypothetical protein FRC10_011370 [Ceratobasidium sp. 414]|nr:hypothetical protein FRC10_011370 [Ceratobasidium sp. 414]
MARSDRVALSSIKTLTLYADQPTKARRTGPVPQLECTGKVCRDYQPSAIQCTNTGGTDIDIDWKVRPNLTSSQHVRGRSALVVAVWPPPRLVRGLGPSGRPVRAQRQVQLCLILIHSFHQNRPDTTLSPHRTPQDPVASPILSFEHPNTLNPPPAQAIHVRFPIQPQPVPIFHTELTWTLDLFGVALVLLAIFLYINRQFPRFLNPFASAPGDGRGGGPTSSDSRARFGYGTSGSGFAPPPPPYTKHPSPNQSDAPSNQRWTPGFWSGAGGLAASTYHYLTNRDRFYNPTYSTPEPRTAWDWERPVFTRTSGAAQPEHSATRRRTFGLNNDDGGAGSSTGPGTHLGEMRRATGFGGSSVR